MLNHGDSGAGNPFPGASATSLGDDFTVEQIAGSNHIRIYLDHPRSQSTPTTQHRGYFLRPKADYLYGVFSGTKGSHSEFMLPNISQEGNSISAERGMVRISSSNEFSDYNEILSWYDNHKYLSVSELTSQFSAFVASRPAGFSEFSYRLYSKDNTLQTIAKYSISIGSSGGLDITRLNAVPSSITNPNLEDFNLQTANSIMQIIPKVSLGTVSTSIRTNYNVADSSLEVFVTSTNPTIASIVRAAGTHRFQYGSDSQ